MNEHKNETWDLWYPQAGATGMAFARGRVMAGVTIMLVHAAPQALNVTIRDEAGDVVAQGKDLARQADTPMCRLTRAGDQVRREDIWPTDADLGTLVILAGGEVGTLCAWWHAVDHSEWRWQIELYYRRR